MKVKRQADLVSTDPSFNKLKTITNPSSVTSATSTAPTRMPTPPPPITVIRPQTSSQTVKVVSRVVPQSSIPSASSSPMIVQQNQPTKKVLIPVSQPLTAGTLQALQSQGLVKAGGVTADGKRIIVVKKSLAQSGQIKIVPKTNSGEVMSTMASSKIKVVTSTSSPKVLSSVSVAEKTGPKKAPSLCQACYKVPPKFECSGCSNMWYCSQICQKDNWTSHQHKCKTVIKQELPDDD